MSNDWVELDGSFGEGGGQILRTSLALSLITSKPFRLHNIRARRPKPGLQPQHLMSVQAATAIGSARVLGASLKSTELSFEPGEVVPGDYTFRIGTAGATGLVLHTIYLPLALAGKPSHLIIEGGTHVKTSPCYDFLATTWRGYMDLLGLRISLNLVRPGFYPRGGGVLEADIEPVAQLTAIDLPGSEAVTSIAGFSIVAGLPAHIAARQARQAHNRLAQEGLEVSLREESWPGGPGSVLVLILNTSPVPTLFFSLGERGKPAERVADEAVDQVLAYLATGPAGVDEHSADQILLPLALAHGTSHFPTSGISTHLMTNADVIHKFVDRRITWKGRQGHPGVITVL
jgi:RNA 3'-phosphate cyclase